MKLLLCIYTVGVSDKNSLELLYDLSIYHLIDEIVVYLLSLTYGKGGRPPVVARRLLATA